MIIAADVGGTSLRVARIDAGVVLDRHEEPTSDDPDQLVSLLRALGRAAGAVIGVPGRVDYGRGRVGWAPNLGPRWPEVLTEAHLSELLGMSASLANDADLAAVGEAYLGAGQVADDVCFVTLSTGVGAGVVLRRRLVRGASSLAEIGHTVVDRHTFETVEGTASGTALARLGGAPGEEVVARAADGDERATAALEDVLGAAAVTALNLVHLFSPQVLVVGGGLGMNGDLVLDPMRRLIAESGPPGHDVTVVNAALGDDAALLGAGSWAEAMS